MNVALRVAAEFREPGSVGGIINFGLPGRARRGGFMIPGSPLLLGCSLGRLRFFMVICAPLVALFADRLAVRAGKRRSLIFEHVSGFR